MGIVEKTSSHNHSESVTNSSSRKHTGNSTGNSTANSTANSTSNTTSNSTGNSTGSSADNNASNVTGNHSHNSTHNGTHNGTQHNSRTHNKTSDHKHLKCKGGSLAACQCLFACKVFGSQPSQCSGSKAELVDTLIQKALSSTKDACRGMQCIVRCAKTLHCYDEKVRHDCRALANHSSSMSDGKTADKDGCHYECDDDAH